ncbi:hypothetical protein [Glaciecola petra]|uniref:Lipoprotein n=1 Tax=Glaciecola petra TaxID=3075602 RepID=A0ABU2ZNG4_9ALTE|nr:hypothetical protein [Aestuariibacter sp. P117]MDT0594164.1 hypothetical protein [Aestuariibacter sp. P117]
MWKIFRLQNSLRSFISQKLFKRSLLVSVFLMFACSEQEPPSTNKAESENITIAEQKAPLLSLNELLAAQDVKLSLAAAAADGDDQALLYWQQKLLDAADEVNLLAAEKALMQGEQGLVFLAFQGMKTNYQAEFEEAFYNFSDLDAVYRKYPAFQDMHATSKELVDKRDKLIKAVAQELIAQGFEGDALKESKRQWQVFVSTEQTPN